jgi:hypothetical protein
LHLPPAYSINQFFICRDANIEHIKYLIFLLNLHLFTRELVCVKPSISTSSALPYGAYWVWVCGITAVFFWGRGEEFGNSLHKVLITLQFYFFFFFVGWGWNCNLIFSYQLGQKFFEAD